MKKIRDEMNLLIIGDSDSFRDRIVNMLSNIPDLKFIGGAGGVVKALNAIKEFIPDAVTLGTFVC